MFQRIVLTRSRGGLRRLLARGFSLLELMVAVAVFLIAAGAAFTLFNRHQVLLAEAQGLGGLNIGLRNALTQIQIDAINAGNGITPSLGPYAPAWPVGFTITNQAPTTACNNPATYAYTASCFDTLTVILADANTPPWHVEGSLAGGTVNTYNSGSSQGTLYATPAGSYTPSAYAASFKSGDTILLVNATNAPPPTFTTVTLTANGTVSSDSTAIVLPYHSTSLAGVNSYDSWGIASSATPSTDLSVSYSTSDWLIRLSPIIYSVDTTTDSTDPKLTRQVGSGTSSVVMEQVVSFKVGAAVAGDISNNYYYSASSYSNDFAQVQSIRVSLIGRTKPNSTNPYRNQFDQGPYQVLGASIVVNPRNLTMNNQ